MARHPATEGNDLQPNRVDAKRDVTVQGASVADAAQAVFVQDDEPEAPIPDGSRWTDTSLTPPATFIYDDSTSVWIPINAGDRTFVSETKPDSEELLKGDMWFNTDPDDDDLAQEIYYFDGDVLVWLGDLAAIPDPDVYLHDDWGDNKLQDREDSGTTTHNGVEGVYRPEWTIEENEPTVTDETLQIESGDAITTEVNLNLDETIVWELPDFDYGKSGGSDNITVGVMLDGVTINMDDFRVFRSGYQFTGRENDDRVRFAVDDNILFDETGFPAPADIRIERSPNGEWSMFHNDNLVNSVTDTTYESGSHVGFAVANDQNAEADVSEIKVR